MAIETATEEDMEMARTRKTDENTENIVPLRPEIEEQSQVDDQPEELGQLASDQHAEAEEPSESQSRSRGPALNRVELIGRIAKGPDVRATHTGMHLAYFRVATNGRDEKDTEFHQCTAFGKAAEFIGEYLTTGRLVYLDGRLQTRAYDDPDGPGAGRRRSSSTACRCSTTGGLTSSSGMAHARRRAWAYSPVDKSRVLDALTAWGVSIPADPLGGWRTFTVASSPVAQPSKPKPEEDTEMARTRKSDEITQNIVPLRPDREVQERATADDQPEQSLVTAPDDQPEPDDAPEQEARRRGAGPSLNRVELIGRIAKGPDVRATRTGMHVVYFRVVTNGREERDTEFHQCTAFGKTAEFIGEYLSTGRLVWIEGRLQTRAYDDPDGVKRWVTTVVVNRLQALDQRRKDEQ